MDMLQETAMRVYEIYNGLDNYLGPMRRLGWDVQARAYPVVLPVLNKLAVLAQDSPAILTVGVLLLFLLVAMQVVNTVRRVFAFWMRLVMRLTFWGGLAVLVATVWQRGVGRSVEDVSTWGRELSDVWWREYNRWDGYQGQGRATAGASWR